MGTVTIGKGLKLLKSLKILLPMVSFFYTQSRGPTWAENLKCGTLITSAARLNNAASMGHGLPLTDHDEQRTGGKCHGQD